jgi:hypothetical protein
MYKTSKYFSGSSCLWLFTCATYVTNGAEHHVLFIWNKISVDSTQLHMSECQEMRIALNKGIQQAKYGPGSTQLLFTCANYVTNGAEHHVLFIWNKISVDSTQLHMLECQEMRIALNKGIQQAKYGPGCTQLLFSEYRNCTSYSSHLETYRARRDKDPCQNVTPVSLIMCSSTRFLAGTVQGTAVFLSKGDVLCITWCYVPEPTTVTFSACTL